MGARPLSNLTQIAEEKLEDIKRCIINIFKVDVTKKRVQHAPICMELYTHVYDFCTVNHTVDMPQSIIRQSLFLDQPKLIYNHVKEFLESYVSNILSTLTLQNLNGKSLIKFYTDAWNRYQTLGKLLDSGCSFMNNNWIQPKRQQGDTDFLTIYELALATWRFNFLENVYYQMTDTILEFVEKERNGEKVDRVFLANILQCYIGMGRIGNEGIDVEENISVYKKCFEEKFFEETERFFLTDAENYLKDNADTDFSKYIDNRIKDEQNRDYLHQSTLKKLMKICENVLKSKCFEISTTQCDNKTDKIEEERKNQH